MPSTNDKRDLCNEYVISILRKECYPMRRFLDSRESDTYMYN